MIRRIIAPLVFCVVVAGCAMPMTINALLESSLDGVELAKQNAAESHKMRQAEIKINEEAVWDALEADVEATASQPSANHTLKLIRAAKAQVGLVSALREKARADHATTMSNLDGIEEAVTKALRLIGYSQSVGKDVRTYIDTIKKGYADAKARAAEAEAAAKAAEKEGEGNGE